MNTNDVIGKRLEEERRRLGLTAIEVYQGLEIAQTTYKNYEMGRRDIPASLLTQLWDIGFDVLYVLTGVYADSGRAVDSTPLDEYRLVKLPETKDTNALADHLLVMMYQAEYSLIQAGAVAKEDYTYRDLLLAASVMQHGKI